MVASTVLDFADDLLTCERKYGSEGEFTVA
jgi:hypothetical protein